jgi:methylated-DNA-[protein]-cysteine S-methyltransferase
MTASGFALFDTAIGQCGVAWGESGVAGVQLPEAGERKPVRACSIGPCRREASTAARVQKAVERIVALPR